jgi:transcriptional regulator with XRE-family HTH domain
MPKIDEYPDMRAVRNGYGLSRHESALIMGISVDEWGAIERGETRDPDNALLYRARARRYLAGNPERLPDPLIPYEKPIDGEPWAQPVQPTAEMVAAARRWMELSVQEVAKRARVSPATWRSWERGLTRMPLTRWLGLLRTAGHPDIVAPQAGPEPWQLEKARYEYVLTQAGAAKLAGVSSATWWQWEHGKKSMPAEVWKAFVAALLTGTKRDNDGEDDDEFE